MGERIEMPDNFTIFCDHCGSPSCVIVINAYPEGTSVSVKCPDCDKEEYI